MKTRKGNNKSKEKNQIGEKRGFYPHFSRILYFNYKNILNLEFSTYQKPTHNDRYLHFSANSLLCVKRVVVIF